MCLALRRSAITQYVIVQHLLHHNYLLYILCIVGESSRRLVCELIPTEYWQGQV